MANGHGENTKTTSKVDSVEEAMGLLKDHEIQHTLRFAAFYTRKNFGSTDLYEKKHLILWNDDDVEFSGVPYIVVNQKCFDCQHGVDRNRLAKINRRKELDAAAKNDHFFKRKYNLYQNTKKFGCPAQVKMKEIIEFPEVTISTNVKCRREKASKLVREMMANKSVVSRRKIVITFPTINQHKNHEVGQVAGISQTIDQFLANKIEELVKEGVGNVNEMRRHLKMVVKRDLFLENDLPPKTNKRYFPRPKTIRNHMVKATRKLRRSLIDQDCLIEKIDHWKQEDPSTKIFFRPKAKQDNVTEEVEPDEDVNDLDEVDFDENDMVKITENNANSILFVFQTQWQRRLLARYGNEMAFLDATYRTTRYALPLFFLVVKTNVDYQIAASFICETESTDAIEEALSIIKGWNQDFSPTFFMTDYSNEEITAIESLYKESFVFICDFHREQAWERWLNKKSNGCSESKQEILAKLRRIAHAMTEEDSEEAIKTLRQSNVWKHPSHSRLVEYIERYWLKEKRRWVSAYRQQRLLASCNTNNGTERQNESFKYQYLNKKGKSSLTGMLTILVEEFLTEKYERYCKLNLKARTNYRRYTETIPKFLLNRPKDMVAHSMEKITLAENIDKNGIIMISHGKFIVPSANCHEKRYEVHFGNDELMPSCTCFDWHRSPYLCKHFFAIFGKFPAWSWDALSGKYRNSPFMTLDFSDKSIAQQNLIAEEHLEEGSKSEFEEPGNEDFDKDFDFAMTIGKQKKISSTHGPACRALLDDIRRLTFLLEDKSNIISQLHDDLSSLRAEMHKAVPRERGISLRPEEKKKKTHKNSANCYRLTSLQQRKRKGKFSGRVGEKKEKMMRAVDFKIDRCYENNDIEEEIIMDNEDIKLGYNVAKKDEDASDLQISNQIKKEKEKAKQDPVLMEEIKKTTQEYFSLVNVHEPLRQHLTAGDLKNIGHQKSLTGNVIAVLQKILKNMYPNADGLQDPLNGIKLRFRVCKKNPFVQVLHDGNYHWITISTYHCQPGEVIYMDSLFSGKIAQHVQMQISSILRYEKSPLTIKVIPVQQQKNFVDCGLFAVAFAQYVLHHNEYPSPDTSFDQSKLRHHVLRTLAANKLDPFPLFQAVTRKNSSKLIEVELFCSCRLPWCQADNKKADRQMALCTGCNEWYHRECQRIPRVVFEKDDADWLCESCNKNK